jgi:Matrixin
MRWRRILCVVAICFVFTGSLSSAPSAHNFLAANKYGTWKWFSTHHPPDLDVGWRFHTSFPATQKRDRVRDAFKKWNAQGQELEFENRPEDSSTYEFLCSDYQEFNGFFYDDVPGGNGIGWGRACAHQGNDPRHIHNFWVVLEEDHNWYSGTEKSEIGDNQTDLKAVAIHEIGHITGWYGHFEITSNECDTPFSITHTMCPGPAFLDGPSTIEGRSLELHDKHTFDDAYVDR